MVVCTLLNIKGSSFEAPYVLDIMRTRRQQH
jgi:hypothetical protein